MIDTLNIGSYIYSKLNTITSGGKTVKVYPLIADNDAKFPFIVYKRVNLYSNGCKDGYYEDEATMQIVVVTDNYATSVEIANEVRERLELTRDEYQDMDISFSHINSANEDFINNAFVQTMQFQITVNKYTR